MEDILEKMRRYIDEYNANSIQVYFSLDDDDVLASDEVYILSGDYNCPHPHRYDPETGHGWHEVTEDWEEGDRGLASLNRALDKLKELSTEDYKCKACKKIKKANK